MDQRIVVVSGIPRSGTSMMMQILEAGGMGVVIDDIRAADDDNPRGYYEFEKASALGRGDVGWLRMACGKAVKIVSTLLTYLPIHYAYQVIFMRRDIHEVLASQNKMLQRRGVSTNGATDAEMSRLFEEHIEYVTGWVAGQANFKILELNHHDLLESPLPQLELLRDFLATSLDVEAMTRAIDSSLYRQRWGGLDEDASS